MSTRKEDLEATAGPHRLAVAADIAVFTLDEGAVRILCVRRGPGAFEGSWALPGGFLRPDETIDECALRELAEESGVTDAFLERFGIYSAPDRDPRGRVVSVAYLALVRSDGVRLRAGTDATEAAWFPLTNPPLLAFDHDRIIGDAVDELQRLSATGGIVLNLMPEAFTMSELQEASEQILGQKLDRRNFRKRFLELGLIEETGDQRRGAHRPAAIYRRKST